MANAAHDASLYRNTEFSLPLRTERATEETKFDDIQALQEAPITVEFVLPDDSTISSGFKKGQTVLVLKCFLEEECELSSSVVSLFYRDKRMLDPFSLTDFAGVESARSIQVTVRITDSSPGCGSTIQRK